MCMAIEIIPFKNLKGLNLLLEINKNESADIIDHRLVVYKHVKEEFDDRINA